MSNSEGEGSDRNILVINQDLRDLLKMKLPKLLIIDLNSIELRQTLGWDGDMIPALRSLQFPWLF